MGQLNRIRELRRHNLAKLRDEKGANQVAALTELPPALLYQMSLGRGKNARNVSDAHARLIETRCELKPGWLDTDHDAPITPKNPEVSPPKVEEPKATFHTIMLTMRAARVAEQWDLLHIDDQVEIENLILERVAKRKREERKKPTAQRGKSE